jgi:hypothetical protein
VRYGPPPGYPGHHGPPGLRPPTDALAYVRAVVFLICGDLTGNVDFAVSAGLDFVRRVRGYRRRLTRYQPARPY